MPATTTEAQELRNILKPSPVRCNRIPTWFRRALLEAFPGARGYGGSTSGPIILDAVRRSRKLSWLDHWGSTESHGQEVFVSEPYSLDLDEMRSIAELAETIGCKCEVSANSFHYPGSTLRVLFLPGPANAQVSSETKLVATPGVGE